MSVTEWVGRTPPSWPVARIKHLCRTAGGGTPDKGKPEYWHGEIPWVSPKDMKSDRITDTEDHITTEGLSNSATKMVPPNSVLLVMRSGILRHSIPVAINQVAVSLNQDMRAFLCDERLAPRFLARLIEGHQPELLQAWSKVGATVESLESDLIGDTLIPLPPRPEQEAIMSFLDRETSRLDALVAAKQRVLDLLSEKRKAIIATGVTRGLDPNVKLRASGVPWLGEIPAHWEHRNLRFCCTSIQTGGTPAPEFLDYEGEDGLDWLTPCDFSESLVPERSSRRVAPGALSAGDLKMFPSGAVLVVGIGATLGKVALLKHVASANQQVNALTPREDVDGAYLAYEMSVFGDLLRVSANTATLPILNQQRMGDVTVLVPPLAEQQAIVEHIVRETAKLDAVRAATERTITLLKERRAALIAAAVTGQLDLEAAA